MIASRSRGLEAARSKSLLRGFYRQIAGRHAFVDDVALADSGAFDNPLIAGFDHLLEIGVGQKAGRDVSPQSADFCSGNAGAHKLAHSMSSPVKI